MRRAVTSGSCFHPVTLPAPLPAAQLLYAHDTLVAPRTAAHCIRPPYCATCAHVPALIRALNVFMLAPAPAT